jgi:hypothetical protein
MREHYIGAATSSNKLIMETVDFADSSFPIKLDLAYYRKLLPASSRFRGLSLHGAKNAHVHNSKCETAFVDVEDQKQYECTSL